jgi:UDP-N-acetylmuramate: L-alanyl-gamma-D-glutamyl-meso-diaminopimelate ligase
MNYHFIAIGGSAMHNLAIALHKKGDKITGSDDEIFEPSRSRLLKYGLLPEEIGWNADKINNNIDAVVLGMHAKIDNPELLKAKDMNIPIYSYPEFLYNQTQHKKRVVVGGSHGKTSTTAMVLHILKYYNLEFDYMVGAQLDGFDTMVNFSDNSNIAVFEGDEYLTSPIDLRPKFHLYKPNIGLITGIAWDHINVFPTFENYKEQFSIFIDKIEKGGTLIYFEGDDNVVEIVKDSNRTDINFVPYSIPKYKIENGITYLLDNNVEIPIKVFGEHNLQNISGAKQICLLLGISESKFNLAIKEFEGASKRLQLLGSNDEMSIYLDFAHSPSKLKATIDAVKQQYKDRKLIACMELHTYSSLNKDFLIQYKDTMNNADVAIVFYSEHALKLKNMDKLDENVIAESFNKQGIVVLNDKKVLIDKISSMKLSNTVLLFLSSGNFDGLNLEYETKKILDINNN